MPREWRTCVTEEAGLTDAVTWWRRFTSPRDGLVVSARWFGERLVLLADSGQVLAGEAMRDQLRRVEWCRTAVEHWRTHRRRTHRR
ncbi:hypothetical protein [Amycolatopsis sp. Poz14]|uniref:hypothetical protein n=1 Tax=Amycolatopsis sp. Poz14 TaxID=1447705 RepID=UPI001EE9AB82|nr:hypothetical protein [Amycolatopsis sp. Poz14]MCG3749787.1 hypothetical protein [Amycolatopsis sp. Poz14]